MARKPKVMDVEPVAEAEDAPEVDHGIDPHAEPKTPENDATDRIQMLGMALSKYRDDAVRARAASGTERRWYEDMQSYHGMDMYNRPLGVIEAATGSIAGQSSMSSPTRDETQPTRSTVFVQLTRQKTNTAWARIADMLFPNDEKNWGIKPTPIPELGEAVEQGKNVRFRDPSTGQPLPHPDRPGEEVSVADVANDLLKQANKKSEAMTREIDDALTECSYNGEGRKVIFDAAMLGTGVLKGPVVVSRTKKKWAKQQQADGSVVRELRVEADPRPASFRVDPWDFFPDPSCGEDIQNGSYVWEREFIPARKLKELARLDGYIVENIRDCLRESPQHATPDGSYFEQARGVDAYQTTPGSDTRYELWTYTGDVSREDLECCGVDLEGFDELQSLSAIVVLCNNRVIKALLNPLETGDFPYDLYRWERISLSPWGVGIPYLMRYAQRTINAAWRAMLDNMAVSHAPQIVMHRSITPADGRREIVGRKLWFATDDDLDVTKAFALHNIDSHQQELAAIIKIAMDFADQETALPMLVQGEQGSAPDTVGGMTLLMNSANVVLKRLVKQYDDQITRPHIGRYYDWFMQNSEKEEIKGDYEVDARGSSSLVVRDQQQQGIVQVVQSATHPVFGIFVDPEKLYRKFLEMNHISPDDVMRTKEQIEQIKQEQKNAPPPLPLQIAQEKAKADIKKTEIDVESERNNELARQADRERDREHDIELLRLEVQSKMLDYAQQRQITLDQAKVQLAQTVIKEQANTKRAREGHVASERQGAQQAKAKAAEKSAKPPVN